MNKLCSRNTALATAAGRSGCAPLVSQPLAVFSPFDVLVLFILALFVFLPLPLSLSPSSCIPLRYPRSRGLFLAFAYLILLPFLSFPYFFSSWTALVQTSDVFPLSRSFRFFFASVNDPGVSLCPHSSCKLYCAHARELCRGEPERARDSPLFTLRVGVPATEQISNKWDGCAKPRRFNYWCLVAAHRESRATAPSLVSLAATPSFLPSPLFLPQRTLTTRLMRWRCSLYLLSWMPS